MNYVELEKIGTGDGSALRIHLTALGRTELVDERENPFASPLTIWFDLLESHLCNGWMTVSPEQIGALTSDPYIITDSGSIDDEGNPVGVEYVYAYPDYQIFDALDQLEAHGTVDLRRYDAEQRMPPEPQRVAWLAGDTPGQLTASGYGLEFTIMPVADQSQMHCLTVRSDNGNVSTRRYRGLGAAKGQATRLFNIRKRMYGKQEA